MSSTQTVSKGDEKYLEEAYDKMEQWIKGKKELEKNIRSLEEQIGNKNPKVLASCRDIHELEKQYMITMQAVENTRVEIGLLKNKK